jgi:hypothetical protein
MLLAMALVVALVQTAVALIMGGEGNQPVGDPGWPKGAAAVFNIPGRVAWWEGPPFGGGEWHAECRGDAKAFNAVLADFARIDVKTKRVVLHDGVGHSFWLNPNRTPGKAVDARVDWSFVIWQPASWERLRSMPADLNPTDPRDAKQGPPALLEVYTGGNLRWSDVTVPKGIELIDQRMEAHGFKPADGIVLEGKVIDLNTKKPLAARVRLERIEPQQKGGYQYKAVVQTTADAQGHWVLKKTPALWLRVIVEADGYVPRVAGYAQFDNQPSWHSYDTGLAPAGSIAGRVTDEDGKPLADATVQIHNVTATGGGRYESSSDYSVKTDADGHFHSDQVPVGSATLWVHKPGYCRPGLGLPITTPAKDIALSMKKAARMVVTVDFSDRLSPPGYIVEVAPEGGEAVGKWGGSGQIDPKNQITFENIPPGRYTIVGHPNPSSQNDRTPPMAVELKGGETTEHTIVAK